MASPIGRARSSREGVARMCRSEDKAQEDREPEARPSVAVEEDGGGRCEERDSPADGKEDSGADRDRSGGRLPAG